MSVADILRRVEEFCPFAQSLKWDIGQAYLRGRGSRPFIEDAVRVPSAVNNDGLVAAHAAEVLFESCRKLETTLPERSRRSGWPDASSPWIQARRASECLPLL